MGKGSASDHHHDPSDNKHDQKFQAVLLADSFTPNFRPITLDKSQPKVLCPLNNVTMLDYSIEFLAGAGIQEIFIFCVSGSDAIEQHVTTQSIQIQQEQNSKMKISVIKDSSCENAGDVLRALDKRNVIQSDPFLLLHGDVITNVDIIPAIEAHKKRKKKDNSAIMTMLFKKVGSWNISNKNHQYAASPLRSTADDDLIVGLNPNDSNRLLLYDSNPKSNTASLPCSFFTSNSQVDVRSDLLDVHIDICSPDVLARFSDEFDYRDIRRQFVVNSVCEEEEGLQNKIFGHVVGASEYAARIVDFRTYGAVSKDLLHRWCYPVVPDNLPSGYEKNYRYVMGRHGLYRECKVGGTKIGRSSVVRGAGMVGCGCWIGEACHIQGTVIGHNCNISNNVQIKQSHIWNNVTIEENTTILQSILCQNVIIKKGATIGKGCIIGKGCVIGSDVTLPDFTRVTFFDDDAGNEFDDDDEFGSFDDSSSSSSDDDDESSGSSSSGGESEAFSDEEENENDNKDEKKAGDSAAAAADVVTDHDVVGKDGLGRVWIPRVDNDDDSDSDYDDDDNNGNSKDRALLAVMETMKSQSIGYDATAMYVQRMKIQEEENDLFSDDEHEAGENDDGDDDGQDLSFGGGVIGGGGADFNSNFDENGMLRVGRQKNVNVVQDLKALCLEHEKTSPIENLAIELNSYKFSQNATYADCSMAAMLAILEHLNISKEMSAARIVSSLKKELSHWKPLLHKICRGMEEERSLILALERMALGGGVVGDVLSKAPSFRFLLQTLHDEEVLNEDAILSWAAERRESSSSGGGDDEDDPQGRLFMQKPTQDFLEWLQEESESESDSDGDSDDEDDDEDDSD